MKYDYGTGWDFGIELLSITEMKRGAETHYPYVTCGQGKGIIEDTYPYEFVGIVEKTDKDGTIPQIIDMYSDKEEILISCHPKRTIKVLVLGYGKEL